ncbi:hypothetical protein I7I48_03012 [Histoplasma ohiense]|nr:hypothetical protein I7I48_03012 [Histoplasma ohiense (nom. inval.)]
MWFRRCSATSERKVNELYSPFSLLLVLVSLQFPSTCSPHIHASRRIPASRLDNRPFPSQRRKYQSKRWTKER